MKYFLKKFHTFRQVDLKNIPPLSVYLCLKGIFRFFDFETIH